MARAGGNSGKYGFSIIDVETGLPVGDLYKYPSVTTIINRTYNKGGGMIRWAYNNAIEGVQHLVAQGYDVNGFTVEQLKALLWETGYTPEQKRDDAGDRGDAAHQILETVLKKNTKASRAELTERAYALDEEQRGYALAAIQWAEDVNPKPLLVEHPLLSFKHETSGTFDVLWADRSDLEVPILTDAKTSAAVRDTHPIQLGAYDLMLRERADLFNTKATRAHIPQRHSVLLLKADGTYENVWVDPLPEVFITLRGLYDQLTKKDVPEEGKE